MAFVDMFVGDRAVVRMDFAGRAVGRMALEGIAFVGMEGAEHMVPAHIAFVDTAGRDFQHCSLDIADIVDNWDIGDHDDGDGGDDCADLEIGCSSDMDSCCNCLYVLYQIHNTTDK